MTLPEICIKRPVLSIVMTLVLVIVGMVSYTHLQVRQYPQVDRPVISVISQYEGAGPQVIESRITKPLESALAAVEGVEYIKSTSESESSKINLFFKPNRDIDAAASDVRDRIARVRMKLPEGVRDPMIRKSQADAAGIIDLALYSDAGADVDVAELYDYAHHYLENEIESIAGVASVEVLGSNGRVMHVWLDAVRMAAYRITTQEVYSSLKQQNVHMPAGRVIGDDREFVLTTAATLKDEDAYKNVIVKNEKGYLVKLKDIAKVEFSPARIDSMVMYNGRPAVDIGVMKKSVGNPLEISAELRKMLPTIRKNLPKGMHIEIAQDTSVYIKQSIDEVYHTFFEATICVLLVILLFLWSFRASFIPLITIPVSIIATFTLLYIFGFSINTLTLLAVVLAIGLVVDDAIVMMENIHRYIEMGMKPREAALKGSKEISFAIIAMTLTLAAVYAPISLSTGMIGKLFTEFALTLAGSVMISGFVALTLSPMMCAHILRGHDRDEPKEILITKNMGFWTSFKIKFDRFLRAVHFEIFYKKFEVFYEKILRKSMVGKGAILGAALLFSGVGAFIGFKILPSELAPQEDQGYIMTKAYVPQGATISYIARYMDQVDQILRSMPEVKNQLSFIKSTDPYAYTVLSDWSERKRSSMEIVKELESKLQRVTGITPRSSPGSTVFGGGKSDDGFEYVLQTTQSFNEVNYAAALLGQAIRHAGIATYLNTSDSGDSEEYVVDIDRDKAGSLGIEISTIGETLDMFIRSRKVTDFRKDSEQFDVIASVSEQNKRSLNDLNNMYVRGRIKDKETMVALADIITLRKNRLPNVISHYNQLVSVELGGPLASGISLGKAVETIEYLSEHALPTGIRSDFSGETRQFLQTRYTIYLIFGLALTFIFLVMAAQFESFSDPLIIMFTVPLSLSGALITLKLVGGSVNIYTQIGLITLIGLITKHGILIVEFANQIRENDEKMTRTEAVIQATMLRLRPILMTTSAMVLGAIPLVFSVGAGAQSRRQIGWVIFGGMLIGTVFTLFVIPAIYTILSKKHRVKII
ncbi:MAG: efflux RND transporter permease subunit [Alphaproteobacteria bacterium]